MNVADKWWDANHICSGRNYEELVEIKAKSLTHVASVTVFPPLRRHDHECYIYGEISFNVGDDPRGWVTLYSRERDSAEFVDLSDAREGCCLTLSDDHEYERPLPLVNRSKPFRFQMKLYETRGGPKEQDILIADIKGQDSHCRRDQSYYCEIEGELGFRFELGYSVVFGARVEVGVKIKEVEGDPITMWGHITAYQYLEKLDHSPCGETATLMRVINKTEPLTFNVGDRIELERRFVVAPMNYDTFLCIRIALAPVIDNDKGIEIYFPLTPEIHLDRLDQASFWTNKEMTHTKDVRHNGTVFSVSITFFPPEEDKHDPKFLLPGSEAKVSEAQGVEL